MRTLSLLERPEVIARTSERYRFFLVDEFQDTNAVQRVLLERLALAKGRRPANLFIVGDRKQSIYGFRGADVDVFREMTATLLAAGGEEKPLQLNFRSQPPLIAFFNYLFARLFQVPDDVPASEYKNLDQLGYVKHEKSEPKRELRDEGPLVELLVTTKPSLEDDPRAEQDSRVLDAQQVARRILTLTRWSRPQFKYGDIALLFRAMTQVQIYESVFRRANIPYQTVLGRGFYEREEITDLIQLLRFLDNKTDEIALAAVLRSPLCGISDNALLALRCAPTLEEVETADPMRGFSATAPALHRVASSRGDRIHQRRRTRASRSRFEVDQRTGRSTASLSDSGSASFRSRGIGVHDRCCSKFRRRAASRERRATVHPRGAFREFGHASDSRLCALRRGV